MRILMTGAGGLLGRALWRELDAAGHVLFRLEHGVGFAPLAGFVDGALLARAAPDAVVHLAGENIAAGRWSAARKRRIQDSRVLGTRLLVAALARTAAPPPLFIAASAVGYYGDRGDEELDEGAARGDGFLAEVAAAWEAEAAAARAFARRVVCLRFGAILAQGGGMLGKVLPLFKWGLGGRLGDGRQWLSWIGLDDAIGVVRTALHDDGLDGAVNAVAPEAVTNARFTRSLARALKRPALFPAPAPLLRLALGELAGDLLLASCRAVPRRLLELGHPFVAPDLDGALARELAQRSTPTGAPPHSR